MYSLYYMYILCVYIYCVYIQRGRWMLESDLLTSVLRRAIIFRETHGECSSRQLSWPHYSSVSLRQMISVISKGLKTEKLSKHTTTLAKHINTVKKKDKIDSSCPCFVTKLHFIMYGKHIAYSLSPALGLSLTDTHIVCTHLISANVINTTLTILSVTV